MNQVFISYAEENSIFVKELLNALEQAGFSDWYDSVELRADKSWRTDIDNALRNSFAIIIVLSPAASASDRVQYESAFARGSNIKIIHVFCKPTEITPELEHLENCYDLTNRKQLKLDDFNEIVNQLHQAYLSHNDATSLSPESEELQKPSSPNVIPVDNRPSPTLSLVPSPPLSPKGDSSDTPIWEKGPVDIPPESDTRMTGADNTNLRIWTHEAIVNLKRGDSRQRADAAGLLGELGNDSAVEPLLAALSNPQSDSKVCKAVVIALGKLKNPAAVPGLIEILENKTGDIDLREATANALSEIRDPLAVPALIDALAYDPEMYVRLTAAKALGLIGDPAAVPQLVYTMLNVRWHLLRRAAVWALGEIGDVTTFADLLEALTDDDEQVRRDAALVTIKIWTPHALKEALWHRYWRVREAAVWAYGQAKYPGVVPDLVELLYDEERNVRLAVAKALGNINDPKAIPELMQRVQIERDDHVLLACITALGTIGNADAVESLTGCLFIKGDYTLREAAAKALGKIGHHSALAKLRLALDNDPSPKVQVALIQAIAQIHHVDVVPILSRALYDEEHSVRHAAAKSLEMIGSSAAKDALSASFSQQSNRDF